MSVKMEDLKKYSKEQLIEMLSKIQVSRSSLSEKFWKQITDVLERNIEELDGLRKTNKTISYVNNLLNMRIVIYLDKKGDQEKRNESAKMWRKGRDIKERIMDKKAEEETPFQRALRREKEIKAEREAIEKGEVVE